MRLNLAECSSNKLPLINLFTGHIQGTALIDARAPVNIIENKLFSKLQKANLIKDSGFCFKYHN